MALQLQQRQPAPRAAESRLVNAEAEHQAVALQEEEGMEDGSTTMGVEVLLNCEGIQKRHIDLLRKANVHTIDQVLLMPCRELRQIEGISDKTIEKMKIFVKGQMEQGFQSAKDYADQSKNMIKLQTGSTAIDTLLEGGIETGSITELVGEFRTGKTQLCHTLAVTCQLPLESNGGEGKCLWIDTENTFRPSRVIAIAKRFNLDPERTLDNIMIARAYNSEHQLELLIQATGAMVGHRYSLVIVDSATALFRAEYTGRGELNERQQKLGRFLRILQRLADIFGCAVVVTNQVVTSPDPMAVYTGNVLQPIGGNIMAHASQTRLFLKKARGDTRKMQVFDSPSLPEAEAEYRITDGGVDDLSEDGGGKKGKSRFGKKKDDDDE
uniref:DNA repair protein RAD51 homolog n=1 Tax=Chromera velia CCMP2878 TaxID=1169474 RepID=A0A0G4IBH5_9ALVE|eukprot:Cvel_12833.t1-p1 / transcript=Cvel_12833.t1 / gene=Cvel_12833 / organism=Chromera_velia_CCMP2878 / gene_product=DNA repair protein RAD51 homolog B, putative / transcript_product=DNA repair protein RAD51 homolog B, putative / location=Cvel_scaffold856:17232-19228(+) / protein_length=381 / sequence_SO=supercontig / SO=protein_coding / is_pseudo=false